MMNDIIKNVSYIEDLGNLIHLITFIENELNELENDVNFLTSKTVGKISIKISLERSKIENLSESLKVFGRQMGKVGIAAIEFQRSMQQLRTVMAATSVLPVFNNTIKLVQEKQEEETRRRIMNGR